MGKCGTADTPVYFALSTLPLGRAAAVKDFRLGLKYLTPYALPGTLAGSGVFGEREKSVREQSKMGDSVLIGV